MIGRCPVGFTVGFHETTQDFTQWTADMDALQRLGGTAIRAGVSPWLTGPEHLAHVRRCLLDARARGLQVMLTCSQLVGNDPTLNTPALIAEAVEYVGKVSDEVGGLVDWWQVGNENDARDWRDWSRPLWDTTEGTAEEMWRREADRVLMDREYLEGLRDVIAACSARIKRDHPDLPVFTAVTGVGANTDREHIWRRFFDVIAPVVDAIAINLYPVVWWEKYREMPARLRRTALRYRLPILITEIGLPSMTVEDEAEIGEWVAAQVDRASRSSDVRGVWLYELRDQAPTTDPEYQSNAELRFGTVYNDGAEKPGAGAVRAMIRAVTT